MSENKTQVANYLVQSILVTLCCCLPFGIVAIIFSSQVNSKLAAGDVAGAEEAAAKAKMWCWVALGVGLAINLIVGIIYGVGIAAAIAGGGAN